MEGKGWQCVEELPIPVRAFNIYIKNGGLLYGQIATSH
jgi:hypothetical protein